MNINSLIEKFTCTRVLVIGDAMIDTYMWGEINRKSPEAPVPIVEIKKIEDRLGGAANVALNIQSLGGKVTLCSVIGDCTQNTTFKKLMQKNNLSLKGIIVEKGRLTTKKTRVIADKKHQIRIDQEISFPIKNEKKIIDIVSDFLSDHNVIVLQDYNKGVLTPKIIKTIIKLANKKNIPTIVDPKINNFKEYKNCTIFKPNLYEISKGMGTKLTTNLEKILKTTSELRKILSAKAVLLTLSENGMLIFSEESHKHFPAIKRKIKDVSGAGDTVIAVSALCLANKVNYDNLTILSNIAAGIVCEEVGVVPIDKIKLKKEFIIFSKND